MRWTPGRMLVLALLIAGLGAWLLHSAPKAPPASGRPSPGAVSQSRSAAGACREVPAFRSAAASNAGSVQGLAWAPWGREELGWDTYVPLVAHEIGSACPSGSTAFAAALARWQKAQGLVADGIMNPPTFEVMRVTWLRRRPFVQAMAKGCPAPAPASSLAPVGPDEAYWGQPASLRPAALAAYRRMLAAARAEVPEAAADKRLLTIFSGFRAPTEQDAECQLTKACGNLTRASCSAHRTGLAFDLFVGAAPGHKPESSDDVNRLFQSRTPVYRWLAANADRFGFVPYPFEPWHWEWTGEAP